MDYEKNITVAFSGHRTYQGEANEELRCVVARLYDEGYRRFLCGMAWGFAADAIVVVSKSEGKVAYRMRNDYLVDNSSVLVAWFDGQPRGGTAYTVRRARRKGVRTENLYPQPQMELQF